MSYVTITLNHFRALQRWAAGSGATLTLNPGDFQLEVKHRNRYFQFFPQFAAVIDDRFSHVATMVDEVVGFAGWLPYRPYVFELSTDKLLFKKHLAQAGLLTPRMWSSAVEADEDFVLKRSIGSFGVQLAGPFRVAQKDRVDPGPANEGSGILFAEKFVAGKIVKAWFWGARPFFAHVHDYPLLVGDGVTTVDELARARARLSAVAWAASPQAGIARSCMAYQQREPGDVMPVGERLWVEFRYGRRYGEGNVTPISDSKLESLPEATRRQMDAAGALIARALAQKFPAPVAYALDGMLDEKGDIWWLEMNSNPVFPPDGYAAMFADLFGAEPTLG